MSVRTSAAIAVACAVSVACSSEAASPEAPAREREKLSAAVAVDPVLESLAEVSDLVDDKVFVRAASILDSAVIPASRARAVRIAGIQTEHASLRALRERAVALEERRARALGHLRDLLARGTIEDFALSEAYGELARCHQEMIKLLDEMGASRAPPRATGGRSP